MVSIAAAASSSVRRSATTSSCGSARWSSVRTVAPSSATQTVRWCRPSMSISSSSLTLCRLSQRGCASLDIRANAGGLKRVGARRVAAPGAWEPWHHGRIRRDRCRRARRPVRDRDLQPPGAAAEPRARGLERDRRPAPPPRRPVPNLVETVKGYAAHERGLFEEIAASRQQSLAAKAPAEQGQAERRLEGGIGRLLALAEAYPELKADANFRQLQGQLAEVEDQLQMARRYYNGTARDLNTLVQSFPSNLVAGGFGFKEAEFFETDEASRAAPQVSFAR